MFCIKCGKENIGDSKFCVYCGAAMDVDNEAAPAGSTPNPQTALQTVKSTVITSNAAPYGSAAAVKPKKFPLAAIIGIAAAIIAVSVVLVIVLVNISGSSPLKKTMNALFPEGAALEKAADSGFSVTIGAKIKDDIYDAIKIGNGDVEVVIRSTPDGERLSVGANASVEGSKLDAEVIKDSKGISVGSESLLNGKKYSIDFENITKQIDKSPFAPDSGTIYSMPDQLYDMIDNMEDGSKKNNSDVENRLKEAVAESLKNVIKKTSDKAEKEKSSEEITLCGETFKASVVEIEINNELIRAFTDALQDEWEESDDLRDLFEEFFNSSAVGAYIDSSVYGGALRQIDYFMNNLTGGTLNTGRYKFKGSIKVYTNGGYLVKFDADLRITYGSGSGSSERMRFTADFSKNPASNPHAALKFVMTDGDRTPVNYSVEYSRTSKNAVSTYALDCYFCDSYRGNSLNFKADVEKDGSYEAEIKTGYAYNSNGTAPSTRDFETNGKVNVSGKFNYNSSRLYLSVNGLSLTTFDRYDNSRSKVDILSDTEVYLELKPGGQSISRPSNCTNISDLDEDTVDNILDNFTDKMTEIFASP